ncbi:glucosaminidase domain-containing protein [Solitalea koreensis]|uniref:Peptidoglycan hydrolase n=1 Tax=Solitalea koreensis TaxID=543615 RepID=A0A521AXS3_9SPHI|nr:glucosaminidase domain-containing protein [Solitalea koreensis]SMO39624.1 Flagellum-specific peptidoglycan hydrolase FlgJ [Solitalea koreensis]
MKNYLPSLSFFTFCILMSSCTAYRPLTPSTGSSSNVPSKDNYPTTITTTSTASPAPSPSKSTGSVRSSSTEAYIQKYKGIAVDEMKRTGIPASITLAQGILESGSGNSDLATMANNHFGIKCTNDWQGETYYKDDDRPNECFRKYPHVEGSFHDHSEFLKRPRYAALYKLDPSDYKGWAYGLKSAGYATHSEYAPKLINLIDKYDLTRFDKYAGKETASNNNGSLFFEQKPTNANENQTTTPSSASASPQPIPAGYYLVKAGDTLYSIARKFNLKVEDIVSLNNLESYSIEIGQKLKVTK